jgi:hypothetical protein
MRRFDVRWVPLTIAAGAFVGSALVSSVAEANDESSPVDQPVLVVEPAVTPFSADPVPADPSTTDPSRGGEGTADTSPASLDTIDIGGGDDGVVAGEVPDPPFDDIAVIEMVMPDTETTVESAAGSAPPDIEVTAVDANDSAHPETTGVVETPEDPAALTGTLASEAPSMAEEPDEDHGGHEGGSGGQGNPYRMTFTVIWLDANGTPIAVLDAVFPTIDWRSMFELTAASETGKGMPTSATCTYPTGSQVLQCVFDNPGHGSGTEGLIVPARPTASYTVTVTWPSLPDWSIENANGGPYFARDLCPRGDGDPGGGHEGGGGHESGGDEGSGHESGGNEGGGDEGGGNEGGGGHESGGGGRGVACEHTVVLRQQAAIVVPPTTPPVVPPTTPPVVEPQPLPPAAPTPAVVEPESLPPVVAPPAAIPTGVVAPTASAPQSLPSTGSSISMIILIAALLVGIGSVTAALTRRTS